VKVCLENPTFSILRNGSPTGFFQSKRGIRRRGIPCPLTFSRLLWKRRTLILKKARIKGEIMNMRTGVNFEVSQMIFADDLQVFSNGNEESLEVIQRVFFYFERMSGLAVIKDNRRIYLNRVCSQRIQKFQILGMDEGCLPIKYLGLPLSFGLGSSCFFLTLCL